MRFVLCQMFAVLMLSNLTTDLLRAAEWTVPFAGNAYLVEAGSESKRRHTNLSEGWSNPTSQYSVYFRVDRPAELTLKLQASQPEGVSRLAISHDSTKWMTDIRGAESTSYDLGKIQVAEAGYVKILIQGEKKSGSTFGTIQGLGLKSETKDLQIHFVRDNEGNMFYWGRRGPSVHLRYQIPTDQPQRYAYSEITVPQGQDQIGSYFMANGFDGGYFGFQVNSETERRVLFSIWSPFQTDDPSQIPAELRIRKVGQGKGVHIGEFGNEGSGGQSYLVYPWKAGITYRFLTEIQPEDSNSTRFTSWFSEEGGDWLLIASFVRPQTQTYVSGFHSFLENFNPTTGDLQRIAEYGNVWVCDLDGKWTECLSASFSVDGTGSAKHRLDFSGGAEGDHFFMKNCGFFNETTRPGEVFHRESTASRKPQIDFATLPR